MSFGGSGSGGSLHSDSDVALSNPANGQVLGYSSGLQKWQNISLPGISQAAALQAQLVAAQVAIGTYSGLPSSGTIDGVTVTDGMVLLLNAEVNPVNNGLWQVNASANWSRPTGYNSGTDSTGAFVVVQGGNTMAGTIWTLAGLAPHVVDTNNSHWNLVRPGSDRGFVNAYSLYNPGDTVVLNTNVRVLITTPVQASSTAGISSANYVVIQYLQSFDIRMYGAKVDATTDDTAAIQAAINAAANFTNTGATANGGIGTSVPGLGGIVFFPTGTTRISATLDLPSNVHLRGAGWSASCIQLLPNSNCHMITTHRSTGSGNSNAYWCSVRDLMLDGRRNNQGALLSDCTLVPGSTTITSAAGSFAANGTLIMGVGILPGTTIISGGGSGTATLSQAATFSALQQAPGAVTVYQGGTTDHAGAVIPWCAIYHETYPYNVGQTGDNQFDPSHLFADLRIYYMCGDGIRIHGRSDVMIHHVKVSFAVNNGYTVDFDTKISESMTEFTVGHALQIPGHSSVQVTDCKFYNSYAHGIHLVNGAGELTFAGVDLQQINLDGLHLESQKGVIFNGTIAQAGFVNASSSIQTAANSTWTANHAYNNFRTSSIPSTVNPVSANGFTYACYVAGTSGSSEPSWPTTVGQTVTDGGVTWACISGLPASVSLASSAYSVIDAICQGDNNALRITGASNKNSFRLAHNSTVVGQKDISSDSLTVLGSGNSVMVNGISLTNALSTLVDATITNPAGGQYLSYNGSAWTNTAPPGIFYGNVFGDGSDGTLDLDGTNSYSGLTKVGSSYTLTKDLNAAGLTIESGVTLLPNGWKILCRGNVTNNGTISAVGNAASGSTAGAVTSQASLGGGQAGATGTAAAGSAGAGGGLGVGSGGSGGSGASGAGGTPGYAANGSTLLYKNPQAILSGAVGFNGSTLAVKGGGGGGSGAGDGTNKGGAGGSGGGVVAIIANSVTNTGTITVAGGTGGNGTAGNVGGGAGGGSGLIIVLTTSVWTNTGTTVATGGAGGSAVGSGSNGSAGGNGNVANFVMQ